MILFLNVFITDDRLRIYDRGELGQPTNRLDVFKYSLASLSVIEWEHVYIYCELDDSYKSRRDELDSFITELFPNANTFTFRNAYSRMWKAAISKLTLVKSDGLVWFCCNDDHIFVDSSLDALTLIHNKMLSMLTSTPHIACMISHWCGAIQYYNDQELAYWDDQIRPVVERKREYFIAQWARQDSIQILSLEILKKWWIGHDYGELFIPRSDNLRGDGVEVEDSTLTIVPLRELVAHFDGNAHIIPDLNLAPPLSIPSGFFENKIKVQYCHNSPREGWVHVNPTVKNFASIDSNGVNSRGLLSDIPLFWKNRIAETSIGEDIPDRELIANRNESVIRFARPLWKGDRESLISAIEWALVRDSMTGEIPLLEVAEPIVRFDYVSIHHKTERVGVSVSAVLLDRQLGDSRFESIESLGSASQNSEQPGTVSEVILVSPSSSTEIKLLKVTDILINSHQFSYGAVQSFHNHIPINRGVFEARGDLVLLSDTACKFYPQLLTEIRLAHASIGSDRTVLLWPEVSAATDTSVGGLKFPTQTLSLPRRLFLQFGGLDEDRKFMGNAGSYYELLSRLELGGCKFITMGASRPIVRTLTIADQFLGDALQYRAHETLPVRENVLIARNQGRYKSQANSAIEQEEMIADLLNRVTKLISSEVGSPAFLKASHEALRYHPTNVEFISAYSAALMGLDSNK